jgi:hypothetical protein
LCFTQSKATPQAYGLDAEAHVRGLPDDKRLRLHHQHSRPVVH